MNRTNGQKKQVVLSRAIEAWVDIKAPVGKVFHALTTPVGLQSWLSDEAESEQRKGGALRFVWNTQEGRQEMKAVYRECKSPRLVEIEFLASNGKPIKPDGKNVRGAYWPAVNRFRLEPASDNSTTRLHLYDTGVNTSPEYDDYYRRALSGWNQTLANLKSYCETGKDARSQTVN